MCEICLWMMNDIKWLLRHNIFKKGETIVEIYLGCVLFVDLLNKEVS